MKIVMLRHRREELGYDLARIADLMRVDLQALMAIEEAEEDKVWHMHEILLLRRYCKLLDLDWRLLRLQYELPKLQAAIDELEPPVRAFRIKWWMLALCLLLVGVGILAHQALWVKKNKEDHRAQIEGDRGSLV